VRYISAILIAAAEEPHRDDNGQIVTHHWLLPEQSEIIYGTLASLIIFYLLYRFAGPPIKKGLVGRTERIQAELDASAGALADAEAEAAEIRQAKGDIEEERQRLLAAADAEAEALLIDGRARLEVEIAELEARAAADLEAAAGRSGDELRSEMIRVAGASMEEVVAHTLDDTTQQDLIESFIQRVGAST
jgi:F0F1-type ATP synthase membrane subunit b/b'